MTDDIGLPKDQIAVILVALPTFRSIPGALDGHGQQAAEQSCRGGALGGPKNTADFCPGIATEFVVTAHHRIRLVMANFD